MLTDIKLRALQPREALYRVADAESLAIEVPPIGRFRWRYRYRFAGKAKMLSLGTYPPVKLAEARKLRDAAKLLLTQGVDPSAERQSRKTAVVVAAADAENTFGAVAATWSGQQQVADVTATKTRWLIDTFLLPDLAIAPFVRSRHGSCWTCCAR